jgi:hypothetical protein
MPKTVQRALGAVLVAGLGLFSGAAAEAASSLSSPSSPSSQLAHFDYQAPRAAGCPTAEEVQAAIVRGLEADPFRSTAGLHLSVAIRSARDGSRGLTADIALSDEAGESLGLQRIRSRTGDCRVLSDAAALAARMILEPAGDTDSATPSALPAATPASDTTPAAPVPAGVAASISPPATSSRNHVEWVFSLGPIAALGASLGPNVGAMAGVELRWRQLSLGVDLRADLPDSAALSPEASEQTSLIAAGLTPCRRFGFRLGSRSGALAGCALLFLGREQADGVGLVQGQTLATFYAAGACERKPRSGSRVPLASRSPPTCGCRSPAPRPMPRTNPSGGPRPFRECSGWRRRHAFFEPVTISRALDNFMPCELRLRCFCCRDA